jgi:NDP-sugar pyrophosphorylase family protein
MQGLILAGGEGRRLAEEGVATPKALVPVGGQPLLLRLVRQLLALGCPGVTVMLREGVPVPSGLAMEGRVAVHQCRTPGSLDTLALGFSAAPPGPVFCTMVDTVMSRADWERVFGVVRGRLAGGADTILTITPGEQDDLPLVVRFGRGGRITELVDQPAASGDWVTGGVYGFSAATRALASQSLAAGVHRMRDFLRRLLAAGLQVESVDVARMVDLDHRRSLGLAEALLSAESSA